MFFQHTLQFFEGGPKKVSSLGVMWRKDRRLNIINVGKVANFKQIVGKYETKLKL